MDYDIKNPNVEYKSFVVMSNQYYAKEIFKIQTTENPPSSDGGFPCVRAGRFFWRTIPQHPDGPARSSGPSSISASFTLGF